MSPRAVALAVVLVTVVASIGVGAATPAGTAVDQTATPTTTPAANASAAPMGEAISMVMQANAAQVEGTVENGMWAAAFANASNESTKRALVDRRVGQLNGTIAELQAERRALQAAYRNGTISQSTYRARLSAIVGRLSALDEGIDETADRGAAVGVNRTRLDELRTAARTLGGQEVSRLARNLTGGPGAPEWAGGPGDGPPSERGQSGNETGPPTRPGDDGEDDADEESSNTTREQGPPDDRSQDDDDDETDDSRGQGSSDDRGGEDDEATATPTDS